MRLVFVHLGPSRNPYLISNLTRTREIFPSYPIDLVVSPDFSIREVPKWINLYKYRPTEEDDSLLQLSVHDSNFRQGFWRYSLERIFALQLVHELNPTESILHIESDILLFPDFPFTNIENHSKLIWNRYNIDHDVSALLYSPSLAHTLSLINTAREKYRANPSLTDMTLLSEIRKELSSEIDFFSDLNRSFPEMLNPKAEVVNDPYSGLSFGGLFDGAPLGMWLIGHDPKNNYGISRIHNLATILNGNSLIDPSRIGYELDRRGQLYAYQKENPVNKVPIWNLHIHAKNSKLLSPNWIPELRKYILKSQNIREFSEFKFGVLWQMFTVSLQSRTFLSFLLGVPVLYKLRRRLSALAKSYRAEN